MSNYYYLFPVLLAIPMIIEDFRDREVRLVWLLLFGVSVVSIAFVGNGWREVVMNIAFNLGLLFFMSVFVVLWILGRNKLGVSEKKLKLSNTVGLGDILFVSFLTPLFGLRQYLIFLLLSMVISLLWWFCVKSRDKQTTIPFIGTSSIVLGCYVLIKIL